MGILEEKRCKTMTLTHTLRSNNEEMIRINSTYLTKGVIMLRRWWVCIGKYQTIDKGKVVYADVIESHPILWIK